MGLDTVELLLAVEDTFQIHIEDEEAGRVATVDDLHQLVLSKLVGPSACLTSIAFYRTRRAFVDSLGIDRHQVRTWTLLELLLPREGRREKWRRIQSRLKLKLPHLAHPAWMQILSIFVGASLTAVPAMYAGIRGIWLIALGLIGFFIGLFLPQLAPWLASDFPNDDITIGDLARDVLAANYKQLAAEVGGASKRDVWETLCRVIVDQTGVDKELVKPGAFLAETLLID